MTSRIKSIKAREILDSRGNPTVEVELVSDEGIFFASVPSGKSKGKYEALELRDGLDARPASEGGGPVLEKRYQGRGVLKAVKNVNEIIGPKIIGKNPVEQKEIDELMIELDGTKNKSNLGSNAILAVSIAICRAGATAKNSPLYQYISNLVGKESLIKLPFASFNIINGGVHAGNDLDFQEFMISPQLESFSKNLQAASEIYQNLREILIKKIGKLAINVGDEGGFSPPLFQTRSALNLIIEAIKLSGYEGKINLGLDCAASQFFKNGNYQLEKRIFIKEGLLAFYQDLIKNYSISFLEDPFAEEDFDGFKKIKENLGQKITIFGDDLLATNLKRIKEAKEKNACNGLVLKPNQIGTVTETLEAAKLAKSFGWKIMVSHRSGETNDDFISDLAVGISADFIKSGAPARGERVAKYNRLLEIEEEIRPVK